MRRLKNQIKRIGIYPGTFDPVHTGHLQFALQAYSHADLDELYFLPERKPRNKTGVEHFGHRLSMLRGVCRPYSNFGVLETDDISFSVQRTLPRLEKLFFDHQLVFLWGSDVIKTLPEWKFSHKLISSSEMVIGLRSSDSRADIKNSTANWRIKPKNLYFIDSLSPEISSSVIRNSLRLKQASSGILSSVKRYSDKNWLYVSLK